MQSLECSSYEFVGPDRRLTVNIEEEFSRHLDEEHNLLVDKHKGL